MTRTQRGGDLRDLQPRRPAVLATNRDIDRLQLYRLGAGSAWQSRYPHAGALLTQPIQTQLIADHWKDLLRPVGSMKFGHTTASLLIAKLHASSRQNSSPERWLC